MTAPQRTPRRTIDLATWPRRSQFAFFRGFGWPFFDLCARIDVTGLVERAGGRGLFAATLHAVMAACNEVPELRQRIEGDEVVEYAAVSPSFTVLGEAETFNYALAEWDPEPAAFAARVAAASEAARGQGELDLSEDDRGDLVFVSCLPWVDFSSVQHPRPLAPGDPDSVPRIAWGRIVAEGDRHRVTVGLSAHHALVDGVHAARFFAALAARAAEGPA